MAANEPKASTPSDAITKKAPDARDSATPGVRAKAPEEPGKIRLPPQAPAKKPRRGMSPEDVAAWEHRLDLLLCGLVVVLAVLVSAFAVRNSDYFQHLAVGRLIAQGQYAFGADPLSFASEGTYWVNHAWLYDLLQYLTYVVFGGEALVVLKAVLVAALALVLMQIRRRGESLWAPAFCTGLAVLVMSQRLLLQPPVVSFFFLGATLWLLEQHRREFKSPYVLPAATAVLCALWVNTDGWFVLGPLAVGLYWLGQFLQEKLAPVRKGPDAPPPQANKRLGLMLAAGLLGCLLNPHGIFAFEVPAQLGTTDSARALAQDPIFQGLFYSPVSELYWRSARATQSTTMFAYYPLLALALVSFALNLFRTRWWRVTVWVPFALLSLYSARSIPFFAVVSAPIMALNFQDFAANWVGARRAAEAWMTPVSLTGRALTLLVATAAVAAAWPGWLYSWDNDERRDERRALKFEIVEDVSLRRAAEKLAELRRDGVLRDGEHGFNYVPDVANYVAWFCPGEKSFLDYRHTAFPASAVADYVAARRGLNPPPSAFADGRGPDESAWQKVFRDRGVRYLVLHDRDPGTNLGLPLARMWFNRAAWTELHRDGRTSVFAWHEGEPAEVADRFAKARYDMNALAFGPDAVKAPGQRPEWAAQTLNWWFRFVNPSLPRLPDGEEAYVHLRAYEVEGAKWRERQRQEWTFAEVAGLVGAAGTVPASPGADARALGLRAGTTNGLLPGRAGFAPALQPNNAIDFVAGGRLEAYYRSQDAGPPAALFLALRAARRALAGNPDDAYAYWRLADAYGTLQGASRERGWSIEWSVDGQRRLTYVGVIRQVQTVAALKSALLLAPNSVLLHIRLGQTFLAAQYIDLAVHHEREALRHLRAELRRVPSAELREDAEAMEKQLKVHERQLKTRDDDYVVRAGAMTVVERAKLANSMGLVDEALNRLLGSTGEVLGDEGARLQLHLLLMTGRLDQAQTNLKPELRGVLGYVAPLGTLEMPAYEWFLFLLSAANGDYDVADKALEDLGEYFRRRGRESFSRSVVQHVKTTLFTSGPFPFGPPPVQASELLFLLGLPFYPAEWRMTELSNHFLGRPEESDMAVLRGLMALEKGDTAKARRHFTQAIFIGIPPERCLRALAAMGAETPVQAAAGLRTGLEATRGSQMFLAPGPEVAANYLEWMDGKKD